MSCCSDEEMAIVIIRDKDKVGVRYRKVPDPNVIHPIAEGHPSEHKRR